MGLAERIIVLCFGLLLSSLLVPILWVMLALTVVTAGQRFVKVWRQASAPRPEPITPTMPRLSAATRWRAWRETGQARPARASRRSVAATTTTRWQERQARRRATRP